MSHGYWRTLALSASLFLLGACSDSPDRVTAARRYTLPAELSLSTHAERGPEGEIYVVGSTNLPDGFKLWVHVESGRLPRGAARVVASDDGVFVRNSRFKTVALWSQVPNPYFTAKMRNWPDGANLKFRKHPFAAGDYRVRLMAYFNGAWQTREVLTALRGADGKKLRGRMLKLTDPDVNDSGKMIDGLETMVFPSLSPESKAISRVKAAVLTVPGQGRSATDVEANLDLFFRSKELKPAKGWTAKATGSDTYEVAYDFINGKAGQDQAIWSVNLRTGEVRYVNTNAKIFSWTPNY